MPVETKPLQTREDQPVSPLISGSRAWDATPGPASRRRHEGIDQAMHSAVQETATNAISAAVTYSTVIECIRFRHEKNVVRNTNNPPARKQPPAAKLVSDMLSGCTGDVTNTRKPPTIQKTDEGGMQNELLCNPSA